MFKRLIKNSVHRWEKNCDEYVARRHSPREGKIRDKRLEKIYRPPFPLPPCPAIPFTSILFTMHSTHPFVHNCTYSACSMPYSFHTYLPCHLAFLSSILPSVPLAVHLPCLPFTLQCQKLPIRSNLAPSPSSKIRREGRGVIAFQPLTCSSGAGDSRLR